MEHVSKKRKLAPKVAEASGQKSTPPPPQSAQHFAPEQQQQGHHHQPSDGSIPQPERRHDFESFARHLQDAALYIYRQTQKSPYDGVSVLLLRWEEDISVEEDLAALEKVFKESYNFHTETWNIPTATNPSIKLGVRISSFLGNASASHLLVIYYAGHGYVGSDDQLYWACSPQDDACKLKWDGVCCLFQDSPSDVLLLLDTCAIKDAPQAGSQGVKQAIAAYTPDQTARGYGALSFTATLCESLEKLSAGRPFSVQRLYEDVLMQRQQDLAQSRLTNGANKTPPSQPRMPICFTLTPSKVQNLILSPLPPTDPEPSSPKPVVEVDGEKPKLSRDELLGPEAAVDLIFDEPRVLVCTTFVGEASLDMQFFNQWLHNASPAASKVVVEGMFLGPPTMLLISMPTSIWNVVEHDKVCCYLGNIQSHNLTHLYQRLVDSSGITPATAKEVEDGRILLEAREAAASSPAIMRRDPSGHRAQDDGIHSTRTPSAGAPRANSNTSTLDAKDDVEDSVEMQEAAEQLKALSHVRHASGENSSNAARRSGGVADSIEVKHDISVSPDADDSGPEESPPTADWAAPRSGQARRPLVKVLPKSETTWRCALCTHEPFKDPSTLRKHIAASHTRPFPCAFSFAGCTSTFGSKNEWKRHIASQHLCLTYYRCSACSQSTAEGKGNEFNRKDLFTQHLRRMHAPFAVKKSLSKTDSKIQLEWESHVKDMQQTCLVTRRQPPQRSACPKPDCQSTFEGPGSWDEWTEHVGKHMEKGEGTQMGVDRLLAKWALEEGIIEPRGNGEYRLNQSSLSGGEGAQNNNSIVSDSGKQEDPSASGVTDVKMDDA